MVAGRLLGHAVRTPVDERTRKEAAGLNRLTYGVPTFGSRLIIDGIHAGVCYASIVIRRRTSVRNRMSVST